MRPWVPPLWVVLLLPSLLLPWLLPAPIARAGPPPREYATVLALGYIAPLDTAEGESTPVLVVDHESEGHPGAATFTFLLQTSRLQVHLRHRVADALSVGYGLRAQVVAEGDGADLYRDGDRLEALTFEGDSAGIALTATLFPDGDWQAAWEGERVATAFRRTDEAAPDTQPPSGFERTEHRLHLRRYGLLGEAAARVELTFTRGRRADWRDWSLDADAARHARYRKEALRWTQPRTWSEVNRTELLLTALDGADLDVLSGYRVGGFGGRAVVAGYFRNEFRAERAAVLNLSHEFRFADDRRLTLLLDGARLRELPLPFRRGPAAAPHPRRGGPGLLLRGAGVGWAAGDPALRAGPARAGRGARPAAARGAAGAGRGVLRRLGRPRQHAPGNRPRYPENRKQRSRLPQKILF